MDFILFLYRFLEKKCGSFWRVSSLRFCIIRFCLLFYNVGVLEGSNSNMLLLLYCFHKCFGKTKGYSFRRVFEGLEPNQSLGFSSFRVCSVLLCFFEMISSHVIDCILVWDSFPIIAVNHFILVLQAFRGNWLINTLTLGGRIL